MAKGNRKIKSAQKRPGLNTPEKRLAFERAQAMGRTIPIPSLAARPKWAELLTDREFAFVREYLIDFKQGPAAMRAGIGLTKASSAAMASGLRRMPHVAQAIDAAMAGSEAGSVRARVSEELAAIAFHNPRQYLEAENRADLKKLPDEAFLSIKKVKQVKGKNPSFEIEGVDKLAALDKLGRATGLFNSDKSGSSVAVQVVIQSPDAGLL